jgi:hypothetical protein
MQGTDNPLVMVNSVATLLHPDSKVGDDSIKGLVARSINGDNIALKEIEEKCINSISRYPPGGGQIVRTCQRTVKYEYGKEIATVEEGEEVLLDACKVSLREAIF